LQASGGNVGIGTTSPGSYNAKLAVYSAGGAFVGSLHDGTFGTFPKASAISLGADTVTYAYTTNGTTVALAGSAHIAALQSASAGAGTDIAFLNTAGGSVTEKARIDSSGRLLVGTSSARDNFFNTSGLGGLLQVEGANNNARRVISHVYGVTGPGGPILHLGKHRSNSVGDNTVVQSGDECGILSFLGSDGPSL
jgi:hypothetical protein